MDSRNDYYTTQRIGNTLFKVRVKFAPDAHETMEEKIMRMIRNEVLEKSREMALYIMVPRNQTTPSKNNVNMVE